MKKVLKVRLTPVTRKTKYMSDKSIAWRDVSVTLDGDRAERRRAFKQFWDTWLARDKVRQRVAAGLQPYAQGKQHPGPYSWVPGGELKRVPALKRG